ncbi:ester cyclase [Catenuloplanes japonicus]|uniref:ester cyclase n=1 Tax=Catenuloplanes japonicus TaxID=33876 RepID=UPI00052494D4|nr:ester cyclase [Catenuloplanes japonicus]
MSDFISPDDTRYDRRSRELVRFGREAIAVENPVRVKEFFSADFRVHAPDGDMDLDALQEFWTQMRDAFTGYYCERREIVSAGALIGARTEMGGVFEKPFTASPVGTLPPHGRAVTLPLVNMFRYDDEGRLAEEWVMYDNLAWLRQLGADPLAE